MNNPYFRCLIEVVKTSAFALYIFLLYELIVIPIILDWSFYGIAFSFILVLLLAWALPGKERRKWVVLAVVFLISIKALNNLLDTNLIWQIFGGLVIAAVLLITGMLAGRFRLRQFAAIFFIAVSLTYTVDLTEIPFWSNFYVKWKSPLLYPKNTSVDYFPVQVADVNNDGKSEILVQGNRDMAQEFILEGKTPYSESLRSPEKNQLMVFGWTGQNFEELEANSYDPKLVVNHLKTDYINFPYYSANWKFGNDGSIEQVLAPQLSKSVLMENAMNFGSVPFSALELSLNSINSRKSGLDKLYEMAKLPLSLSQTILDNKTQFAVDGNVAEDLMINGNTFSGSFNDNVFQGETTSSGILGAGKLLNQEKAGAVLLGNHLEVFNLEGTSAGSLVASLTREDIGDISTSEVLIADVNNDHKDEILLNTEYAKILGLDPTGKWEVIWSSRDDSFRFEDFATLGQDKGKEIIALSKSIVRNSPTRYLTGYQFTPEGLKTKWRIFSGPINLRAADVDGDNYNELIGYFYKGHRVFVLEKHNLPIKEILYGITVFLILLGGIYHYKNRKSTREVQ